MLIAHIADPHLGYRAYHRVTPDGINVREADVDHAFRQALDRVAEAQPDLLLIAGDTFHSSRPSNTVIARAFRRLASLRARCPRLPILIVGGNHDSPKAAETGNILKLFEEIPGVLAVTHAVRQVHVEELGCTVLCVPHAALAHGLEQELEPDPRASTNILMIHGTVDGQVAREKIPALRHYRDGKIPDRAIRPERWDYVALGHYHTLTELAPNMWYPAAIERTSTNIWAEPEEKGFLLYDTETGQARFVPIETRPVLDLPAIDAAGLPADAVDRAIAERMERSADRLGGAIVRLVVTNLPRHISDQLDHRRVREYGAAALHFRLVLRRPEPAHSRSAHAPDGQAPMSVEDEFGDFIQNHWQPSTATTRKTTLLELGRHYLAGEQGEA